MTAIDFTGSDAVPAHTTSARIAELGRAMEAGFEPDTVELLLLAHTARDLGVNEILVQVMIDDEQPAVARVRAFARVSVQVAARLHELDAATDQHELQPAC